jgi:hypothetical protein
VQQLVVELTERDALLDAITASCANCIAKG